MRDDAEPHAIEFTDADRVDVVHFRVLALRLGGDIAIGAGREDLSEACWVTEPRAPAGSAAWVAWRTADGVICAKHLQYHTLNRQFDGMAVFCAWIIRVWSEAAETWVAQAEPSVVAAFPDHWRPKVA
jgi:hypothetical protein